ncbi:hypothetical protein Sj15T_12240 [Sphingobium sp. TA15]|nr:hypothetical protein Sj15T_12240 [Sphingobium sp. TA15]
MKGRANPFRETPDARTLIPHHGLGAERASPMPLGRNQPAIDAAQHTALRGMDATQPAALRTHMGADQALRASCG